MPTATEGLVGGEWALSAPVVEAIPERCHDPEWHSLRLFGRGRHSGGFASGIETHDDL
ncbi:MAG: hypothetical protein WAU75_18705 [Solirubrobacteraceae bacterium]